MYCCSHKINTWKLVKIHVNTVPFLPLKAFKCLLSIAYSFKLGNSGGS